ncbi:MAG: hypothetical protein RBT45_08160, partial [Acholeplasmataceae bacterium]|nr:hypothetical protein [Acholeplasmataceae bacterium]
MKKHLFKKLFLVITILSLSVMIISCTDDDTDNTVPTENLTLYRTNVRDDVPEVILDELERGFYFFWDLANTDKDSGAYGLIPDRYDTKANRGGNVSSIASVGFGLSVIPLGIEADYITREEGEDRAYHTLLTFK